MPGLMRCQPALAERIIIKDCLICFLVVRLPVRSGFPQRDRVKPAAQFSTNLDL